MTAPRNITQAERAMYPIIGGIVTADDPEDRQGYNCHGFAIGVREVLTTDDGPTLLESMAYSRRRRDELRDSDEVVALFYKSNVSDAWHTAKRLRCRSLPATMYESKCGSEMPPERLARAREVFRPKESDPRPGLRIAHPLEAVQPIYGDVHSFWVRDTSEKGAEKRRITLKRDYGLVDWIEIDDSAALLDEIWRSLRSQNR